MMRDAPPDPDRGPISKPLPPAVVRLHGIALWRESAELGVIGGALGVAVIALLLGVRPGAVVVGVMVALLIVLRSLGRARPC